MFGSLLDACCHGYTFSTVTEVVCEAHLAHVDAGRRLALSVSVAQLGYRGDGVETGVLGQRGGNDLQGVGVGTHAVRLHAAQSAGVLSQAQSQLDLRSAAACDQSPAGGAEATPLRRHGDNYQRLHLLVLDFSFRLLSARRFSAMGKALYDTNTSLS